MQCSNPALSTALQQIQLGAAQLQLLELMEIGFRLAASEAQFIRVDPQLLGRNDRLITEKTYLIAGTADHSHIRWQLLEEVLNQRPQLRMPYPVEVIKDQVQITLNLLQISDKGIQQQLIGYAQIITQQPRGTRTKARELRLYGRN